MWESSRCWSRLVRDLATKDRCTFTHAHLPLHRRRPWHLLFLSVPSILCPASGNRDLALDVWYFFAHFRPANLSCEPFSLGELLAQRKAVVWCWSRITIARFRRFSLESSLPGSCIGASVTITPQSPAREREGGREGTGIHKGTWSRMHQDRATIHRGQTAALAVALYPSSMRPLPCAARLCRAALRVAIAKSLGISCSSCHECSR